MTGGPPVEGSRGAALIKVLVSACLLGERVRYDGRDARCDDDVLARWSREGRLVPFCPEVAGGLGVPRPAAEIQGGDGGEVLAGRAAVRDGAGRDLTGAFRQGAHAALAAARAANARVAVLKDGSPSCGSGAIYDGTFSGTRRTGIGVTTALLRDAGLLVFGERELQRADEAVRALEGG